MADKASILRGIGAGLQTLGAGGRQLIFQHEERQEQKRITDANLQAQEDATQLQFLTLQYQQFKGEKEEAHRAWERARAEKMDDFSRRQAGAQYNLALLKEAKLDQRLTKQLAAAAARQGAQEELQKELQTRLAEINEKTLLLTIRNEMLLQYDRFDFETRKLISRMAEKGIITSNDLPKALKQFKDAINSPTMTEEEKLEVMRERMKSLQTQPSGSGAQSGGTSAPSVPQGGQGISTSVAQTQQQRPAFTQTDRPLNAPDPMDQRIADTVLQLNKSDINDILARGPGSYHVRGPGGTLQVMDITEGAFAILANHMLKIRRP